MTPPTTSPLTLTAGSGPAPSSRCCPPTVLSTAGSSKALTSGPQPAPRECRSRMASPPKAVLERSPVWLLLEINGMMLAATAGGPLFVRTYHQQIFNLYEIRIQMFSYRKLWESFQIMFRAKNHFFLKTYNVSLLYYLSIYLLSWQDKINVTK